MYLKNQISRFLHKALTFKVIKKNFTQSELEAEGYVSQCGQDKWVLESLFGHEKVGTFVDIGANDGVTFSNTFRLEKAGWNGIAIEPLPIIYSRLKSNRSCITVNGCIAPTSGVEHFRAISGYSEMLSGLVKEYDSRHSERIKKELKHHGGEEEIIEVDCYNLNDLLADNSIKTVDYLSIDVEGMELKILQSIDFTRTEVKCIGVENNYSDYRIPRYLTNKGFIFHSIVGDDEFYVKPELIQAHN
ncbi:hypothetical protein NBRC116583_31390 [Arenicella sp. 4NH20-0111]|uniref:FkbM family methyltransferase n=1 Tax=Arenicella sp. 4NH20-0111 TaxID=3127648 RepID=UPI0031088776